MRIRSRKPRSCWPSSKTSRGPDPMSAPDAAPAGTTRIALAVEYDGSAFSGWQKQAAPALPTVQSALEAALSSVANHPVATTCAGRTDAGVHATCQVVHFDCRLDRGVKAWTQGVNSLLPGSVRVLWAQAVADQFHARFSATGRRYRYVLFQRAVPSAILYGRVTPVRQPLNLDALNSASRLLIGEQDFSTFRAAGCQSRSPFREVTRAQWSQTGPFIVFHIEANAFLQHMVRNLVGSLLAVGREEQAPEWIAELLRARDRTVAGKTAPPDGLYLAGVDYPDQWQLPATSGDPPMLVGSIIG